MMSSNPLDATNLYPEAMSWSISLIEQTGKTLSEISPVTIGVLNTIDTTAIAANDDNISVKAIFRRAC